MRNSILFAGRVSLLSSLMLNAKILISSSNYTSQSLEKKRRRSHLGHLAVGLAVAHRKKNIRETTVIIFQAVKDTDLFQ